MASIACTVLFVAVIQLLVLCLCYLWTFYMSHHLTFTRCCPCRTGVDLIDLTHEDLASMGVEKLHDRKTILREASRLRGDTPAPAAAGSSAAPSAAGSTGSAAAEVSTFDSVHFQMIPQVRVCFHAYCRFDVPC